MDREVAWTESALTDLDDIVDFIAQDDLRIALKWMGEVFELASSLSQFPNRGRPIPEWDEDTCREVFHGSYRLMYRVSVTTVQVVALVHSRRDFYRAFPDQSDG